MYITHNEEIQESERAYDNNNKKSVKLVMFSNVPQPRYNVMMYVEEGTRENGQSCFGMVWSKWAKCERALRWSSCVKPDMRFFLFDFSHCFMLL